MAGHRIVLRAADGVRRHRVDALDGRRRNRPHGRTADAQGTLAVRRRLRRHLRNRLHVVARRHQGSPQGRSHAGRAAAPALRHDPVHRFGSDVLRGLVLGLLRCRALPQRRDPCSTTSRKASAWCSATSFSAGSGRRCRSKATEARWRPGYFKGTFDPWSIPLINTLILLSSGCTVTWAHHALLKNNRTQLIIGLLLTVILGAIFTALPGLRVSARSLQLRRPHLRLDVLHGDGLPRRARDHRHHLPVSCACCAP